LRLSPRDQQAQKFLFYRFMVPPGSPAVRVAVRLSMDPADGYVCRLHAITKGAEHRSALSDPQLDQQVLEVILPANPEAISYDLYLDRARRTTGSAGTVFIDINGIEFGPAPAEAEIPVE
jgi:hypothetical protein